MKILVTGGSGFMGSHFIRYMLKKYNYEIINLDAMTYAGKKENTQDFEGHKNYTFIKGNICDSTIVEMIARKVDAIVHFAAESHVDNAIRNAEPFVQTNVAGTQVLLDAAKNHNLRFHHISTDEVFGTIKEGKFTESSSYNPRSPYAASKAAADHLVRSYHITHRVKITISNACNNYGPYQDREKLIPLCISNILNKKNVPLYGDGKNVRDWIFVDDHSGAIDYILHKGEIGETYLVGADNQKTNVEVARELLKLLSESEDLIEFVEDRPGHDARYAVDNAKIINLGWKPKVNFEEGLKKTIEWYKKQKDKP